MTPTEKPQGAAAVPPRLKCWSDGCTPRNWKAAEVPESWQVTHVPLEEFEDAVKSAREDAYLSEVTFWIGEHRAYLEAGMIWEAELAMKNSRRYGDLARSAREKGE